MKVAFQVPPKSPKVLASSLSSAQLMKNKNGIKKIKYFDIIIILIGSLIVYKITHAFTFF